MAGFARRRGRPRVTLDAAATSFAAAFSYAIGPREAGSAGQVFEASRAAARDRAFVEESELARASAGWWYLLLVIPFIALLCPVYLRQTPAIAGFPFFYWYQFVLLFVSAGITAIVYNAVRDVEP